MKTFLLVLCVTCLLAFTACSSRADAESDNTVEPPVSISESTPEEIPQPPVEPIESVEIYSAKMWNEFADSYNNEREKYSDYVTVQILQQLDFEDIDFTPLADGFSGKISAGAAELSAEERQRWVDERKKWPLDYNGTFINIRRIKNINGKTAASLFGAVGQLELDNVSFAFIYLNDMKCLFTENADSLKLNNVSVQNCTLSDGRAIAAVNAGNISVDGFVAESCMLTGYEYMGGIACFVSGDAQFKDAFLCRCSFTLSPDNGGSGLWSAGIGLLAKSVNGTASFENIDIYGCNTTGLYTHVLTNSAGAVSKCCNVSLNFCNFMNYCPMGSSYNSGVIGICGERDSMVMPVFEENVSITNCSIGGEYTEADFENRGYFVENCIFTSSKEEPPQ